MTIHELTLNGQVLKVIHHDNDNNQRYDPIKGHETIEIETEGKRVIYNYGFQPRWVDKDLASIGAVDAITKKGINLDLFKPRANDLLEPLVGKFRDTTEEQLRKVKETRAKEVAARKVPVTPFYDQTKINNYISLLIEGDGIIATNDPLMVSCAKFCIDKGLDPKAVKKLSKNIESVSNRTDLKSKEMSMAIAVACIVLHIDSRKADYKKVDAGLHDFASRIKDIVARGKFNVQYQYLPQSEKSKFFAEWDVKSDTIIFHYQIASITDDIDSLVTFVHEMVHGCQDDKGVLTNNMEEELEATSVASFYFLDEAGINFQTDPQDFENWLEKLINEKRIGGRFAPDLRTAYYRYRFYPDDREVYEKALKESKTYLLYSFTKVGAVTFKDVLAIGHNIISEAPKPPTQKAYLSYLERQKDACKSAIKKYEDTFLEKRAMPKQEISDIVTALRGLYIKLETIMVLTQYYTTQDPAKNPPSPPIPSDLIKNAYRPFIDSMIRLQVFEGMFRSTWKGDIAGWYEEEYLKK